MFVVLALASACHKSTTADANAANSSAQTAANPSQQAQPAQDNLPAEVTGGNANPTTAPAQATAPIVIPAGTSITVRLQQRLSSASSERGERFQAVLEQPITSGNQILVPAGSIVEGHVVSAHHSGRLHHPGEIALTLDTLVVGNRNIPLATSEVVAHGGSHKKRNWGWIGGGTGGGAVIGALAAGGKGALIGSGIGAAAGTTTALVTGKKDVSFSSERLLRFQLHQDVTLS